MKKKKYVIVNKRRFYAFLISLLVVIAIIFLSLLSNNKAYSSNYKTAYIEVAIKEGDTLWNIALKHLQEKQDLRKLIFEIKQFNEMESSYIYPGDIIKIPIEQ
ncbi:LysM peptidoglycan-binding domain-containing protein [Tissierella sp. MSJ-40]|uniref:LysM peptidoglycan-binding domain-containing protein n=1 Tax=Tissierella simiarum TaxID=2841534 RepID=A0ABS6E3Z0_9FIRM|nr:LysM peptidoglycan-binding domain-containing protein [Tissierella simiarum]MBU5437630.1 LysM peptidoglycan-binding domain-containing protein [Tissierella simiarum]